MSPIRRPPGSAAALVVALVLAGALVSGCASHPAPSTLLREGAPAPALTGADQDGRPVRLVDLRGRWLVLWFYPKDKTAG